MANAKSWQKRPKTKPLYRAKFRMTFNSSESDSSMYNVQVYNNLRDNLSDKDSQGETSSAC